MWTKETPKVSGQYHTADYKGTYAGIKQVVYDNNGALVWAGGYVDGARQSCWLGWWWDARIQEPDTTDIQLQAAVR